jgi:hypothetical protein
MNISLPHHQLPPPLDRYASYILLEDVHDADLYLLLGIGFLTILAFVQLKAFARPPPVPLKRLPRRPALSILFKPDDISSVSNQSKTTAARSQSSTPQSRLNTLTSTLLRSSNISVTSEKSSFPNHNARPRMDAAAAAIALDGGGRGSPKIALQQPLRGSETDFSRRDDWSEAGEEDEPFETKTTSSTPPETPFLHSHDLPDSFAPLLSSSQTEILYDLLTPDLIHGIHAEAGIRMREGRHEIPLDKDSSRPQLRFNVPKGGVRISAVAGIGSDQFSSAQDLDVNIPTASRSCPMVKHAGIVFDPPLPLSNVAPTLIHFPTLFEDDFVPTLRRIQIFRFLMDAIISISSLIEKLLWIIESVLQIHLSKIRVTPLYKGRSSVDDTSPEWRLSLAFSGHVLLFGWIPIPFINVILPTFIIPQPHALLEYLLTKQPLASAKLRRDNIAEERIALALLDTAETFTAQLKLVATPPAVGVDLTLPGGVSLGLEMMHGRDPGAGRSRQDVADPNTPNNNNTTPTNPFPAPTTLPTTAQSGSCASMSSWTTNRESTSKTPHRTNARASALSFDANDLIPWFLEVSVKGAMSADKMTLHLTKFSLQHEDTSSTIPSKSQIVTRGSLAVWKANSKVASDPKSLSRSSILRQTSSFAHRAALAGTTESPSVAAILFFPDETEAFHREVRLLQYDYAFDIGEDSKLDAVTLSVGANHPMLNGGSMVTTIHENIYAHGSVTAREQAVLDPIERRRKRNILRHLPAIDFTFGIQNSFIPPESFSYTDDGQTHCVPQMDGGRIMVRFIGGIEEQDQQTERMSTTSWSGATNPTETPVSEGIKVVADFGFSSIVLDNETIVKEFPELDIFEGTKLRSHTSARLGGSVKCHLRPQHLDPSLSTTGPNIFNPLEAYEIDFSGSSLSVRIKESTTSLGHRRIIIPTETQVMVKVVESVVDMALEGKTLCELSWDFQGLSPILQVTEVGQSPADVMHEKKEQVSLLIAPLRQGRLNFHVSPVGGIDITKAVTSREDKEGLYDWKFFNALVSPDSKDAERLRDVIHDKRSMDKLLQVVKLVNADAHRVFKYVLTQVWRAKDIFDKEGISDPGHAIPGHKMARLISLFMCGDASQVDVVLPIILRVVAGDGLDVVKVKDLLRQHCNFYDNWAPEIDRGVRWLETMFSPMSVPEPYVENQVTPLSELEIYASRFRDIPSAKQLYEQINDRAHLPLDREFSNMINRLAPYLTFTQIVYFLKARAPTDWQPSDLKRLRYVYSVKRKVLEIAESYGGLSFLPQSFLVSVFLGEATRAGLRATHDQVKPKIGKRGPLVPQSSVSSQKSTLLSLRQRRIRLQDPYLREIPDEINDGIELTPAGRVASRSNFQVEESRQAIPQQIKTDQLTIASSVAQDESPSQFELGDCLLGPVDVAILLQAGLTSVMKGSSVVQLNQRMLLDLVASQPKSFAIAVLAEIGGDGQGSPRALASGKSCVTKQL